MLGAAAIPAAFGVGAAAPPDGRRIAPDLLRQLSGRQEHPAARRTAATSKRRCAARGFEVSVENDLDLPLQGRRRPLRPAPGGPAERRPDHRPVLTSAATACGSRAQLPAALGRRHRRPGRPERSINLQDEVLSLSPALPGARGGGDRRPPRQRRADRQDRLLQLLQAPQGCIVAFGERRADLRCRPATPPRTASTPASWCACSTASTTPRRSPTSSSSPALRVEKTMSTHPVAIVRKLAQRPT